ncbi:MAG: beta-N-acetylhexosaminidase [Halobacteriovoraceae bacterium]|nr:beta-N-acetylhexosaminidase [Halobacteriovoraceae bacterium]
MDLGQLFIVGLSGKTLNDFEKKFLENEKIGGIILFAHNYEDPAQLAELVNSVQTLRDEYPLFISVDQEGGRVIRFKTHFTQFPAMLAISKLDSPKTVYEVHKIMATELSACGINLNFSPVCDILTNPQNKVIGDRAFGSDGRDVEKYISAAVRGLQSQNVLACAKHFPGHGSTKKDSHYDLPYVKTSLEELRDNEFIPFYKASRSRVECIMMAHIVADAIDSERPCSLSRKAYDLLRSELKYKKLILTDDMEMKAIADNYSMEESTFYSFDGGADILIYRTMEKAQESLEALKMLVKTQKISKKLIEEKIKRVNQCKKQYFSGYKPIYIPDLTKVFSSKDSAQFAKVLLDSISKLS